jgi:arsenite methyltransferase
MTEDRDQERIKSAVRQAYGGIARRFVDAPDAGGAAQGGCCGSSPTITQSDPQAGCCGSSRSEARDGRQESCCGPQVGTPPATAYYSAAELDGLPDSVTDASLGCGNPLAIAELQAGEVVLDLGSGGGIDCFLAARQVGPEGRVIGLDMTPDMIMLARRNAKKMGATNVDFRWGEMEEIPLQDHSVDVVISNCVVNLSPDKDAVFREVFRVLRPGGRMNLSDILVDGDLPRPIRDSLDAWASCVAGALDEAEYLSKIRAAGFEDVEVLSRSYMGISDAYEGENLQVLVAGPDGEIVEGAEAQALLAEAGLSPHDLARKVASVKVRARKPA